MQISITDPHACVCECMHTRAYSHAYACTYARTYNGRDSRTDRNKKTSEIGFILLS